MFSLALEMTATEELESLIPVSKAVMEILAPVSEAKVRSPSPEITTPIATTDDPSMPTEIHLWNQLKRRWNPQFPS